MALEVESLEVAYGKSQVLFGVSMHVRRGACVGILGRNGVGKSTLLETLAGEKEVYKGTIKYMGEDVTKWPTEKRAARGMGYVPQTGDVFAELDVNENLLMGRVAGKKNGYEESLSKVLKLFPRLAERRHQVAGTLSGGERKMLAMARALLSEPELLLLDEPTEGVWHELVGEIAQTLRMVAEERAIVIVEQNVDLVLEIADDVYVLERGDIVLHGSPAELKADARLEGYLSI